MRRNGPTPEELKAFLLRCEGELGLSRENVYNRLAEESGMSGRGVRKWFYSPKSPSWRGCPYSVWRLWNLVLYKEDISKLPPRE